ncbi:receptor-type tyrosine-protein phosphatase mu [Sarotherodon galilaeus]
MPSGRIQDLQITAEDCKRHESLSSENRKLLSSVLLRPVLQLACPGEHQAFPGQPRGSTMSPPQMAVFLTPSLRERPAAHHRSQPQLVTIDEGRNGGLRISSLLLADDVVLLASSGDGLQLTLERFAAECEQVGMRTSTSKSEATVLSWKRVECPLRVGDEFLPQKQSSSTLQPTKNFTWQREERKAAPGHDSNV